ncbi:MAG: DUF4474 domain-containing protein [Clostridiales bacterium]|nr:DUF4474 domain-containing protein [Clostridiales bacterium]
MQEKKKVNVPLVIISLVVIGIIAVFFTITQKIKNSENTTPNVIEESSSAALTQTPETQAETLVETTEAATTATQTSQTAEATSNLPVAAKETTTGKKEEPTTESMQQVQEEMTVPALDESDMSSGKASVASASAAKDLPSDMSFAGLYNQGYDVIGLKEFIYNNDMSPDCRQRKYGYNSGYDIGARLIDFTIDTVKMKFNYDGKTYRIQLWKGQYISGEVGTVGGEVGIYTKDGENFNGDHFNCAAEGDELYQEMTILWDENGDGNYTSQLTRNYSLHWWQTGYVDGQLKNKRDSKPLKLLSHMTFKDEEQASAFCQALANQGFSQVSTFNPTGADCFKQHGKDVIYIWQNIGC